MVEPFVEAIVRLCRERLHIPFLHTVRGTVTAVTADGECTVSCWWGTVQHCVVAQPWPDCKIQVQKGADVLLAWPRNTQDGLNSPGELPAIIGFYSGAFSSVQIGRDNPKAAARIDDAVEVNITTGAQVSALAAALLATGAFMPSGAPPAPTPPLFPIKLPGSIRAGSTKVFIGG